MLQGGKSTSKKKTTIVSRSDDCIGKRLEIEGSHASEGGLAGGTEGEEDRGSRERLQAATISLSPKKRFP